MRYLIFPYKQGSEGAAALAAELQGQRILREGSKYKHRQGDLIINWGASDCPYPQALNRTNVAVLDKLAFFQRLHGEGLTPRFATTLNSASDLNFPVYCRTKLRGRDGAGIVVADSHGQLVGCNLYVEGVNKTAEYRVHIGRLPNGQIRIIGAQKKVHGQPHAEQDARVWTGDSTRFVWRVNGVPAIIPVAVTIAARQTFGHFPELTFGAFDIVFCSTTADAYVLEINSAPMMTPETARRYGDFFREYVQVMPQPDAPAAPAATPAPPAPAPAPVEVPLVPIPSLIDIWDSINQATTGHLNTYQLDDAAAAVLTLFQAS